MFNEYCAAQIATDGSLGAGGAQPLTPVGGVFNIGANLGQKTGGNLFHSFSQFNVGLGQTANFTGPADVRNVIVRVSGGSPSQIDGLLRTRDMPAASLFFMNPAGIFFGPGAQLDVAGAFIATTAQSIRLQDGGTFHASPRAPSVLTTADPAAFGFLSANPAPVVVQGATLQTSPGQGLALVGGDVTVTRAELVDQNGQVQISRGRLVSPGGQLVVVSMRSPGEVTGTAPSPAGLRPEPGAVRGDVVVSESDIATVSIGAPDSSIIIAAANLTVAGSNINSDTTIAAPGASMTLDLTGDLSVLAARVFTDSHGPGPAGDISIVARHVLLDGLAAFPGASVGSAAFGGGDTGSIDLRAESVALRRLAGLGSFTVAAGNVNPTTVIAEQVLIDGMGVGVLEVGQFTIGTGIISLTAANATGNGGNIDLRTRTLTLLNSGAIFLNSFGTGDAGSIIIEATETFLIDGMGFRLPDGLSGTGVAVETTAINGGNGGAIDVRAGAITLLRGGGLSAQSKGGGNAGNITIRADMLTIDRKGPGGSIDDLPGITGIAASSSGSGSGGIIRIGSADQPVDSINIIRGGLIAAQSDGSGAQGGSIEVFARAIEIDGQDVIAVFNSENLLTGRVNSTGLSTSVGLNATGPGGRLDVNAESITMRNTGAISAITVATDPLGRGAAGDVIVRVTGLLDMESGASITANTSGPGLGGDVTITADAIKVSGAGRPPDIAFVTLRIPLPDGEPVELTVPISSTLITTSVIPLNPQNPFEFPATGRAGLVSITAHSLLEVCEGAVIASSTFAFGGATGVVIKAGDMKVSRGAGRNDQVAGGVFSASVGIGESGFIDIDVERRLEIADGGLISVDTFGSGIGGSINIRAQEIWMSSLPGKGLTAIGAQTHDSEIFGPGKQGGSITLTADRIALESNSLISATSDAVGNAGDILINVGHLAVTGHSGVLSASFGGLFGAGNSGSVTIEALKNVAMVGGASITVAADTGAASAGEIRMTIGRNLHMLDSRISAASAGAGGNITILPGHQLRMRRSEITATASTLGSALILITPPPVVGGTVPPGFDPLFVIMESSTINGLVQDDTQTDVPVTIGFPFLLNSQSTILTDTVVLPPELDLAGNLIAISDTLAERPPQPTDACRLLLQSSDVQYLFKFRESTPILEGLPLLPSGWLPSIELESPADARAPIEAGTGRP